MDDRIQPFEENLSAVMDGELSGKQLLESIDALVEDGDLRQFWRDARSLQKGLAQPQERLFELPPTKVWDNVEKVTGRGRAKVVPIRRLSPQVWAAAASVVLIFSLTLAGLFRGAIPEQANARTVQLSSNEGKMSEERFLELTSELLQADPRYHRKMLEVMETVNREVYNSAAGARSEEGGPTSEEEDVSTLPATSPTQTDSRQETSGGSSTESSRRAVGNETPVRINLW